jgi:hypothetical protein
MCAVLNYILCWVLNTHVSLAYLMANFDVVVWSLLYLLIETKDIKAKVCLYICISIVFTHKHNTCTHRWTDRRMNVKWWNLLAMLKKSNNSWMEYLENYCSYCVLMDKYSVIVDCNLWYIFRHVWVSDFFRSNQEKVLICMLILQSSTEKILCSSLQTSRSIRIVMVGNVGMNQLVHRIFFVALLMPMVKRTWP